MRAPPPRSEDEPGFGRRHVLAGCAITLSAGLAGCLYADAPGDCDPGHPPPNGFELRNSDPDEQTVTVEIVRDRLVSAMTVYEETFELGTASDERTVRVDDVVDLAGRYVVTACLAAEPTFETNHLWTVAPERCDSIRIRIEDDRVEITQPGGMGIV